MNKLAAFLVSREKPGDIEQALQYFTRDLEISDRLQKQNPNSVQAFNDMAVSRHNLAELNIRLKRYETAQTHLTAGIKILDQMIEKNMNVDEAQRDRGVMQLRLWFCKAASLTPSG